MSAAHKIRQEAAPMLVDTEASVVDFSYLESEATRLVSSALKALEEKSHVSKKTKSAASKLRAACLGRPAEDPKS